MGASSTIKLICSKCQRWRSSACGRYILAANSKSNWELIIRLEDRLQPHIGLTLRCVFGGVHAFGYNSAESKPI